MVKVAVPLPPKKTYPVASHLVRPDQLAIETEIRPLRRGARLVGSGR
jgi:hypothetical protein